MNAFEFMDKQIMDLSRSKTGGSDNDFIDLVNPSPANEDEEKTAESASDSKKEGIHASFDFQPIRPAGVLSRSIDSSPVAGGSGGDNASRAWNSVDSKSVSSPARSYGRPSSADADKVVLDKPQSANDAAILSEIDHALKRHTDNTLHAIDGLSARLSQTEARIRELEHSVDDIKLSIGNNHGTTDGKMRQMENILQEVQSCMQDLKDKQEVMDARLQLEKLLVPKPDKTPESQNPSHNLAPAVQSAVPVTQQPTQQYPAAPLQSLPAASPNAPQPPQHARHPTVQPPSHYPPTPMPTGAQRDTYIPADQPQEAPGQQYLLPPAQQQQSQEAPSQQYLLPPAQQQQPQEAPSQQYLPPPAQQQQQQPQTLLPPAAVQHQHYQPSPPTPYPLAPHPPQQPPQSAAAINHPPPQLQLPMGHQSEESYIPSQAYPLNLHQHLAQPTSGPLPSQQLYNVPPSHMHESPTGKSSSGFSSSAYTLPTGPSEPYPYGRSSSHYGNNPATKQQPHSSGGGGNYPQIPTARVLPQAIPTASPVGGAANSGGSGNRVPIDDVIDKVTSMGFSREQVRDTVRRLTENGQPVDLNVVLDKLMNGTDVQPPRGWFGR